MKDGVKRISDLVHSCGASPKPVEFLLNVKSTFKFSNPKFVLRVVRRILEVNEGDSADDDPADDDLADDDLADVAKIDNRSAVGDAVEAVGGVHRDISHDDDDDVWSPSSDSSNVQV